MPLPLSFSVERSKSELIAPAEPTPYEFKMLSDIDDQKGLRYQATVIQFYGSNNLQMKGKDPVKIIREAVAKTLVHYYPFAGRLREGPDGKLMVECTGEGVLFVKAKANVNLEQFGVVIQPPIPGVEELLHDVPGSAGILHCPLLLIQVTELMCGGFIFAIRLNHTMTDGFGIAQFQRAIADIARGASAPSIKPVWKRELLNARSPPQVSCEHRVYRDTIPQPSTDLSLLSQRCFFFNRKDIQKLRNHVSPKIRRCSMFDILTAVLWKCRTSALNLNTDDEVRVALNVNVRTKFNPPLPDGYYGNAVALPVAFSTAGELCRNHLNYALDLVMKAKASVTEEFMRSTADFLVLKGRPLFVAARTYVVSDLTGIKFGNIDFGWGEPVYGGPTRSDAPTSIFLPWRNQLGQDGFAVTVNLPGPAMEKFASDVQKMILLTDSHDLTICKSSL